MKVITPQGNLGGFMVLGGVPAGTCPECAVAHAPEQPHSKQSLAYQYRFRAEKGSWPTWADAMAHCPPEVRDYWTAELTRLGQEIGELTLDLTKALSLRQPWAWLMLRPDLTDSLDRLEAGMAGKIKDVENRTRCWHYRGRVLVHASATMTRSDYEAAEIIAASCDVELPAFKSPDLERGGIVGEFCITNCVREHHSPWFFGPYGYPVTGAKPLPFRKCKGALGFFTPKFSDV